MYSFKYYRFKLFSKIDNCEECTSAKKCTKCQSGYNLNGGSCEDEINNLEKIGIASVVLSSISTAGAIGFIAFYLIKKLSGKNN